MFARVKAGAINGNLRQNKSVIIQKNGIICKTIECKQKKHVFLFGFQAEISKFKVIRLIRGFSVLFVFRAIEGRLVMTPLIACAHHIN
jgi:hypothetical protein